MLQHYGKIPLIDCTLVEDSSSDIFHFEDTADCECTTHKPSSVPYPFILRSLPAFSATSYDSTLSLTSQSSNSNLLSTQACTVPAGEKETAPNYNGLDFRLIVDSKSGPPITIILLASTLQEKAAWCSDISQVNSIMMFVHLDYFGAFIYML